MDHLPRSSSKPSFTDGVRGEAGPALAVLGCLADRGVLGVANGGERRCEWFASAGSASADRATGVSAAVPALVSAAEGEGWGKAELIDGGRLLRLLLFAIAKA